MPAQCKANSRKIAISRHDNGRPEIYHPENCWFADPKNGISQCGTSSSPLPSSSSPSSPSSSSSSSSRPSINCLKFTSKSPGPNETTPSKLCGSGTRTRETSKTGPTSGRSRRHHRASWKSPRNLSRNGDLAKYSWRPHIFDPTSGYKGLNRGISTEASSLRWEKTSTQAQMV